MLKIVRQPFILEVSNFEKTATKRIVDLFFGEQKDILVT